MADESTFDTAAEEAKKELVENIKKWTALELGKWFAQHYMKAGHKRLGRIVVDVSKTIS